MSETEPTSPLAIYQAHLDKGELAYQVDGDGKPFFYPRVNAPGSGKSNPEWKVGKGQGVVYATTVLYPRNLDPYNVAIIELDEGYRMMSRVENIGPEDVKIGMRVNVRMHPAEGDEPAYPVFDPA